MIRRRRPIARKGIYTDRRSKSPQEKQARIYTRRVRKGSRACTAGAWRAARACLNAGASFPSPAPLAAIIDREIRPLLDALDDLLDQIDKSDFTNNNGDEAKDLDAVHEARKAREESA